MASKQCDLVADLMDQACDAPGLAQFADALEAAIDARIEAYALNTLAKANVIVSRAITREEIADHERLMHPAPGSVAFHSPTIKVVDIAPTPPSAALEEK